MLTDYFFPLKPQHLTMKLVLNKTPAAFWLQGSVLYKNAVSFCDFSRKQFAVIGNVNCKTRNNLVAGFLHKIVIINACCTGKPCGLSLSRICDVLFRGGRGSSGLLFSVPDGTLRPPCTERG